MAEKDLSKIVSLIMENPSLIEEIRSLAESDGDKQKPRNEPPPSVETAVGEIPKIQKTGSRRRELLCALKPYLSDERCRAVDQMLSISDILDMMRTK
jgi:hypothetical protein